MTVTREEIAAHVHRAFIAGVTTKAELAAVAAGSGARPDVLRVLGLLPDRPYSDLRQLWAELPEVPIDREDAARR